MKTCCICESDFDGFGNNPEPFEGETCCDDCNNCWVVPVRILFGREGKNRFVPGKPGAPLELFKHIAAMGATLAKQNARARIRAVPLEELIGAPLSDKDVRHD